MKQPRITTHGRSWIFILGGLLVGALLLAVLVARPHPAATALRPANPPAAPAPVPHFLDLPSQAAGAQRTLVLAAANEQLPGTSNSAGYLMGNLRVGTLPAGATTAVVRTDSNCQPDKDGISHCLNELQVGSAVVTVQHHHNMQQVPCLTPGETVTLMPFAAFRG